LNEYTVTKLEIDRVDEIFDKGMSEVKTQIEFLKPEL
jgi:hypothetical protein